MLAHPAGDKKQAYTIITQEVFSEFPNDQHFQNFDNYSQFSHPPAFTSPPTPPNQQPVARSGQAPALSAVPNGSHAADVLPLAVKAEPSLEPTVRVTSNSEEDDLTPAQSRRKAQNRAA